MKKAKNFLRVSECMSVDPATVGPEGFSEESNRVAAAARYPLSAGD
jgi:hypothetical protein